MPPRPRPSPRSCRLRFDAPLIAGFTTAAHLADHLRRADPTSTSSRHVLLVVDLDLAPLEQDERQAALLSAGALLAARFHDATAMAQCGQRLVVMTDDRRLSDAIARRVRRELTVMLGAADPLLWTDDTPAAADVDRYVRELSGGDAE